ncbi:MAG: hypothetical protein ABJZ69_04975 [Hyphomicrobiales bacterium]
MQLNQRPEALPPEFNSLQQHHDFNALHTVCHSPAVAGVTPGYCIAFFLPLSAQDRPSHRRKPGREAGKAVLLGGFLSLSSTMRAGL